MGSTKAAPNWRVPDRYTQLKTLLVLFVAWKCLLFTVTALAPGPGYDTSSLIFTNPNLDRHEKFKHSTTLGAIPLKLFRWDALYFVQAAKRNKVHEQEWAFSWAYSHMLRKVVELFATTSEGTSSNTYLWAFVAASTLMHGAAVVGLFNLLNQTMGTPNGNQASFLASILHIFSPAGVFLVAPYAESMFAVLNFHGMLCYVQSRHIASRNPDRTVRQDAALLASGFLFSCAAMVRSNGLLSGLVYVSDVASCVPGILQGRISRSQLRFIAVTCIAGVILASGYVLPQYVAYLEYCDPAIGATPPWCHKTIPSIYSWVQSKYWNVGFFRYWTLPNIPLFLLAAPMLWLLLQSSIIHLRDYKNKVLGLARESHGKSSTVSTDSESASNNFPQLVLPQLALALAAAMSFHVQIINRVSSGYPMWYFAVAGSAAAPANAKGRGKLGLSFQIIVRGMIMYAIIQAALFACFLPPA
ncbi:unnamed protein product [Periconia digitata]|uniref:GPI mannosyltransferase 2 n=1 Tax=Periconia digitata TaxID=1303443 RepID=A0A9W4U805_9PLEO|nr:unnamed protein product [Periconia digitata]